MEMRKKSIHILAELQINSPQLIVVGEMAMIPPANQAVIKRLIFNARLVKMRLCVAP